ncbi:leucyl aminopeptidase [Anderseniella sp. Alg231-50]|uniref:leucyl aminopeptidase n=1 Tax=Anderseniella sp. Alg231-50 TaxID=1922226 RepID=UPI000D5622B8
MKISFSTFSAPKSGVAVVLAGEDGKLSDDGAELDKSVNGAISNAMKVADFKAEREKSLDIILPKGSGADRIIVMGVGKTDDLDEVAAEYVGGAIAAAAGAVQATGLTVSASLPGKPGIDPAAVSSRIASGIRLRTYSFTKYKSKPSKTKQLASVKMLTASAAAAKTRYAALDAVATGVHLARDLVNEPANILHPESFAGEIKKLSKLGLVIEVLDEKQMGKLGMGALLGVSLGSPRKPRLCVMRWEGGKKGDQPVAFVGKGVTFDTGGISIKPSAGMEDMKGDMGGAACVTGLMAALAGRKAKVNAIGVVGLVENMPDGNAQRPGDVVTSMSKQTIAVLNTDAEGRLVLADALWYTQDRFKPKFMVNLATLTGAILVALGKEHAGLFSNDDKLSDELAGVGQETRERVWRLPLAPEYDKLIDSDIADMKNIGGRMAGSITAGQFLQRFVNDVPWAHLDVAGTAMDAVKSPINQSWGSGWGVRLLDRLVARHYEK